MLNNHENLKTKITSRYGRLIFQAVRELEKTRVKIEKLLCALAFLKRCRDNNIIPKCVQITPKKHIFHGNKILKSASEKLLRNLIRSNRFNINNYSKQENYLKEKLCNVLYSDDWEIIDVITFDQAKRCSELIKQKHMKKFELLVEKSVSNINNIENNSENKTVINLSSEILDDPTLSILQKGLKFAPTPKRIPVEAIIGGIENCIICNHVNNEKAEQIRQDAAIIIRRTKPIKSNTSKAEFVALKNLRDNKDILVLPADKGNATVIMNTADYKSKITTMLDDTDTYKKVNYNPTNRLTRKTNIVINNYKQSLPQSRQLVSRCIQPPQFYGLPKIHKVNIPLRPVVSQINSVTYNLAKFLAEKLKDLTGNTFSFVKNSSHFVEILTNIEIEDDEIMVSFDVESLFTNVPIEQSVEILRKILMNEGRNPDYADLVKHCLVSTYFMWNSEFYLQLDGVAMGSPISPLIANLWMEDIENQAINTAMFKPKIWLRYVDDTFCIIKRDQLEFFLNHINSIHQKTKFTVELENNGCLAFLDVQIYRKEDKKLGHTVYRKPTHTEQYLHAESHHHPAQLKSVVTSLINRAYSICDEENIQAELEHVTKVLTKNGYRKNIIKNCIKHRNDKNNTKNLDKKAFLPYMKGVSEKIGKILSKHNIKTIFKPPPKVREFLSSPKDKIPLNTPGVYNVPCSCGKSYIGETKRSISIRLKEHIKAIQNNALEKSAIAEHLYDEPSHYIHFEKASILSKERFYIPRLVREAIEIKRRPNFNRDHSFNLAKAWDPVLSRLTSKNIDANIQKPNDVVSWFCKQEIKNNTDENNTDENNTEENESLNQRNNFSHKYYLRNMSFRKN